MVSIMVSESPIESRVNETPADTIAQVREIGSIALANKPPEDEATMSVMMGTIHTGPIFDKSREFCPIIT